MVSLETSERGAAKARLECPFAMSACTDLVGFLDLSEETSGFLMVNWGREESFASALSGPHVDNSKYGRTIVARRVKKADDKGGVEGWAAF